MQQHYELCYIVPIKYLEGELQKVQDGVVKLIKENGGEITHDEILGAQRLAYPINNVHQGTYVVLEFDMAGENMKELDAQMKLEDKILRHLIIKKKIKTPEELDKEARIKERMRQQKEEELSKLDEEAGLSVKKKEEKKKADDSLIESKEEKVEEAEQEESKQESFPEQKVAKEKQTDSEDKPEKVADKKSEEEVKKSKDADISELDEKLDKILTDDML